MTIIFFTDISWFGLHQRPQHIALALAKHWKVLWIQPAVLGKKISFRPTQASENIFVIDFPAIPYNARAKSIRLLAKTLSKLRIVRSLLSFFQYSILKKSLAMMEEDENSVGFLLNNFHSIDIVKKFPSRFILFDYIDNAFGFTKLPNHLKEDWKKTILESTLITVTSPTLAKQIEPYRTKNIFYVGNGVEFKLFSEEKKYERPSDLPMGKKIIAYVGAVYPWLDYELIKFCCKNCTEYNFVFIGPVHPDIANIVSELKQLPNIFFLGFKSYQNIPQYLQHFDVCIIPFQKNELTSMVNPVKLYEYSAAGKPTVTTDFSEDLTPFREHIFIARTKEEFVASIKTAMEKSKGESFVQQIKSFASKHDWSEKTQAIIRLIEAQLLSKIF